MRRGGCLMPIVASLSLMAAAVMLWHLKVNTAGSRLLADGSLAGPFAFLRPHK
jgi:hypothetical protein